MVKWKTLKWIAAVKPKQISGRTRQEGSSKDDTSVPSQAPPKPPRIGQVFNVTIPCPAKKGDIGIGLGNIHYLVKCVLVKCETTLSHLCATPAHPPPPTHQQAVNDFGLRVQTSFVVLRIEQKLEFA